LCGAIPREGESHRLKLPVDHLQPMGMLISLPHRKMSWRDRFSSNSKVDYERADHLLQFVGLYEKRYLRAGSLSFGQQKLLEFAMALMNEPTVLLLDEPTAGMARHDTNATIDLLKKIKEGGMTKVIIEHDMHVVFSLATTVSVLARGTIIASGKPDDIKGDPRVQEAYLGGTQV